MVSRRGDEGRGLRSPGIKPVKLSMAGQDSCRSGRQGGKSTCCKNSFFSQNEAVKSASTRQ